MDHKPPNGIAHGFSVALIIFLCGTDDIPFAVFVCYKEFPEEALLDFDDGVSYGY